MAKIRRSVRINGKIEKYAIFQLLEATNKQRKEVIVNMIELAVDLAKLAAAEVEIQRALAIYREAVNKSKVAAAALLENWEGDAANEFEREQANAYKWHLCIFDVISAFIDELEQAIKTYQEYEERIKALIQKS